MERWFRLPRLDEGYLLLCIVRQAEDGRTVHQQRDDLICPKVLNDLCEPGQELELGTVWVDSVVHYVCAIGL